MRYVRGGLLTAERDRNASEFSLSTWEDQGWKLQPKLKGESE